MTPTSCTPWRACTRADVTTTFPFGLVQRYRCASSWLDPLDRGGITDDQLRGRNPVRWLSQGRIVSARLAPKWRLNMTSFLLWSAIQGKDIAPSAQTERRGNAGPVRNFL